MLSFLVILRRLLGRNDLIIFIIAFIIRLLYLYQFRTDPFFNLLALDSEYYSNWAIEIANGNWLGEKVFFASPLYAYFLAGLFRILNEVYWVLIVQFFLGAIHCVIVYYIGRRIFGETVALISGIICALYGFFIFLEGQILKSALSYFLSSFTLLLILIARERHEKSNLWFIIGISVGLTSLVIPNFIIFVPVICMSLIIEKRKVKKMIASIGAFCAGIAIILAPVTLRNYYVGDDWVLISYNGGINFFLGTEKNTDGGLKRSRIIEQVPSKEESSSYLIAEKSLEKKLRPSEVSHFWYAKAFKIIKEEPIAYMKLVLRKVYRFGHWRELTDNLDFYYFKERYFLLSIPFLNFGMIAPFAFLGVWFSRNQVRNLLPAYIFILFFTLSLIPFPIFGRYRTPVVPVLMIFMAYGIYGTLQRIANKELRDSVIGLLFFLISFLIINSGIHKHNYSDSHRILGQIFLKQGENDKAVKELKKAIETDPQNAEAYNALAKAYYAMNEPLKAIQELQIAISLAPDFVDAHYTLGLIYYESDDKRTIEEFEKVLELDTTGEKSKIVSGLIN